MNRREIADLAGCTGLGALVAFGVLALVLVVGDGAVLYADEDLHSWSLAHQPVVAVTLARGLTATGTGVVPYALAALAGLVAGRTVRGRLLTVALCLACLGTGQAARYGMMQLTARPRPPRVEWATHASGWSFPSGHATTAVLTAGLLVIAVLARSPRGRTLLALAACCWGALVGLTRVYLGVHWFTDVLGGWLFGVGWLGMCLAAVAKWAPEQVITVTADTSVAGTTDTTEEWQAMRPRILVVEDDHALRDVLLRGLRDEDFDTVPAPDGATALRLATADLAAAVLDVGLPDADGRDVCQAMRANGFLAPVVFLTAHHRITDRLSGFSAGGDDYLPKPFHLAELAARLRAAIKRSGPRPATTAGDLVLDAVRHSLTVRGAGVDLTPTEFRLLAALMAASGGIVRRRELVRAGWPEGAHVSDNTLDQYLTRLRRKLRASGSELTVTTARGIGHRLS